MADSDRNRNIFGRKSKRKARTYSFPGLKVQFEDYMSACYGQNWVDELPGDQGREIEQAFLSGIHVMNEFVRTVLQKNGRYMPAMLREELKVRLIELGNLPNEPTEDRN